jgi:hypothetical protein
MMIPRLANTKPILADAHATRMLAGAAEIRSGQAPSANHPQLLFSGIQLLKLIPSPAETR